MDPLGLLYAAIGMLVYPGGVYLTGLAGVSAWTAGLPRGPAPNCRTRFARERIRRHVSLRRERFAETERC